MQLLNKSFDNLQSANYTIKELNRAINTSYIPSGNTIQEVVADFTNVQLSRSFSNCGFGSAVLEMAFNENTLTIEYTSTSNTHVFLQYEFDNDMNCIGGTIECFLPDDRAQSGRCHYETITQALYPFDWEKVQPELIKLNPDTEIPTPEWYLGKVSNFRARDNEKEIDLELESLGFTRVLPAIGFTRVWHNPSHYYQYITYSEGKSYEPFDVHANGNEAVTTTEYNFSYRRLLELLEIKKDAPVIERDNTPIEDDEE